MITDQYVRTRVPLYLLLCILRFFALCFICVLGCSGTEVVKVKVRVDSEADMRNYKTIAVMSFINSRDDSTTDQGEILARMIRKQLGGSKEFEVLDEKNVYLRLEEELNKSKIESPDVLVSISDQLGSDALIVGTFDFYQLNQPVPYIVQRYSPSTGRYNPETRTYIQRVNRLLIHAKVVDGKTGETIFDYSPPLEEKPEYGDSWGFPFSSGNSDPEALRNIAARTVKAFVLKLIPHYEYERRIIVK
jgi:hypothetical protein